MEECKRRAIAHGAGKGLLPASDYAQAIWPGAEWIAMQGAGAAASRVLVALKKDGRACWAHEIKSHETIGRWGWEVW